MNTEKLIGMRVMNTKTHAIGVIEDIKNGFIWINYYGSINKYEYPSAFANLLELEDEKLQEEIKDKGVETSFEDFKLNFKFAIENEVNYLKTKGEKKYRIIDGEKISSNDRTYLYAFDTDTEFHFPDGTTIKIWLVDTIVYGSVVSCEDFTIIFRTNEDMGNKIESVEFTSEQWKILEVLMERLKEMEPNRNSLAYKIACSGRNQITPWKNIKCGQNLAFNRAISEGITFIWGPPGTGKTETLANIALEHIKCNRRVLMLSYSNVSVDGALLRVAKKADLYDGEVIRYGYPRMQELLESKTLTSYQYILYKNPELAIEYQKLIERKKKLNKKSAEIDEVKKRIRAIREHILKEERKLVHMSLFVATTVSKAILDRAIYEQKFDVVIFDEASMAYVPQIVFSANMAKKYFVCLGDFCQLPAIVQNDTDDRLTRDIFEYTGITSAVENNYGHEWLVMLNQQYRMHKDIADFVGKHMYYGKLSTSDTVYKSRKELALCNPCSGMAMSLLDLSGMYSVCTRTMDKSKINILSALICLRLVEENIKHYEVGIITPYSAQARLILAMLRDIKETNNNWPQISCATVHQFQGSEESVIIYDAVDCFRMKSPGTLLTSLKNNTANRLFNVAITRAKGKFVLVANIDFFKRKNISKKLIFKKAIDQMIQQGCSISGRDILDEVTPRKQEEPIVYIENREISWSKFIKDITSAKSKICIDIPDVIDDNDEAIEKLVYVLDCKKKEGLDICIRVSEEIDLPVELQKYIKPFEYVRNPITIIDKEIIWFGQPLYAADFISEGDILDTEYFPCVRFRGKHTARSLKTFLEI